MAANKFFSRIVGTGSFLPGKPVSNLELTKKLKEIGVESSDEWIKERTGITQRHYAGPNDSTSTLALEAGMSAISDSGISTDEIDLIIVATTTPDHIFPSVACRIQGQLGVSKGAAFDIQAVCSGFVYALNICDLLLKSGQHSCALVIGAETLSDILDWQDRTTCVLFGDGAGAAILKTTDHPGIIQTMLHADGKYSNILKAPARVIQGKIKGNPFAEMEGKEVYKRAIDVLSSNALEVLEKSSTEISEIDWFIPHQANSRILNAVAKKLNIPESKLVNTVCFHANTSAASIPLALDKARKDGRISSGDMVLVQGVGGGFTWGSSLIKF